MCFGNSDALVFVEIGDEDSVPGRGVRVALTK